MKESSVTTYKSAFTELCYRLLESSEAAHLIWIKNNSWSIGGENQISDDPLKQVQSGKKDVVKRSSVWAHDTGFSYLVHCTEIMSSNVYFIQIYQYYQQKKQRQNPPLKHQ